MILTTSAINFRDQPMSMPGTKAKIWKVQAWHKSNRRKRLRLKLRYLLRNLSKTMILVRICRKILTTNNIDVLPILEKEKTSKNFNQ